MSQRRDIRVQRAEVYFLPVTTRMPLKFGPETLTSVTCARVRLQVRDRDGRCAWGWGETPLSVQWVWPSPQSYEARHSRLKQFTAALAQRWVRDTGWGHPLELASDFLSQVLPDYRRASSPPDADLGCLPWLAALVCASPFDLALHDAYGRLHQSPTYATYGADFLNRDLAHFLTPAPDVDLSFAGRLPTDFLRASPPTSLRAWHLVGGVDPLGSDDLTGREPQDGYPVTLEEWIDRDQLTCLKVKLRGNDLTWDRDRLVRVGQIAIRQAVQWLSADFNCTVQDTGYVNEILDWLRDHHPRTYAMLLYVEQPFPYELEQHRIDVRSVASRKPIFLDESAHDWRLVKLGRELGWSGVALKTCKTQTGAILSACWAKAHGLSLMVQDLTNPMLAQIPHVLLAGHVGTIMGVETNAMQFYPEASGAESAVHPGLYQRRNGCVDLSSIRGPGFGYRIDEIQRTLPEPVAVDEI